MQGKMPDDQHNTNWLIVARTTGFAPAQIIVGRLQAEGIPARAWQEGATPVGLIGTGRVEVPEEYIEAALAVLEEEDEFFEEN